MSVSRAERRTWSVTQPYLYLPIGQFNRGKGTVRRNPWNVIKWRKNLGSRTREADYATFLINSVPFIMSSHLFVETGLNYFSSRQCLEVMQNDFHVASTCPYFICRRIFVVIFNTVLCLFVVFPLTNISKQFFFIFLRVLLYLELIYARVFFPSPFFDFVVVRKIANSLLNCKYMTFCFTFSKQNYFFEGFYASSIMGKTLKNLACQHRI